ncbi:hypothetical protein SAY86_017971 [Trapa natans]|uniref:N-acetyltransferase domain-containing protein n=1 Tax=Trapa natans TaxID=22666 RepID=A0AAN7R5J6_TRANT|nr:hypothetical protein SAY86_017971 [Trapa natans]
MSSVAVHENFRRMGIAKRLIATAEAQARAWGCRSVALHCELNNHRAMKLYRVYRELGFKCISVPEGAKWPQPKASPHFNFCFMMKLLKPPSASAA